MSLKDDSIEIKAETLAGANTALRVGTLFERIVTKNGWASYVDNVHVDLGSAQVLVTDTDTVLNNNAGTVVDSQKPYDITEFYNGTTKKIIGRNGDNLDLMIYFTAVPTAPNQYVDIWIDITAGVGTPVNLANLYRQTFSFPKGSGVERGILYALPSAYTLDTWEANGGVVYVRSNAPLSIYNINYNFDRTHKAV